MPVPVSSPAPSGFSSKRSIPRSILLVPKDQQVLLDRPDSWVSSFPRDTRGSVNLPASVLDSLRAFHQHNNTQHLGSVAPSTPDTRNGLLRANGTQTAVVHSAKLDSAESQEDDEDEELIPWSASPVRTAKPATPAKLQRPQRPRSPIPTFPSSLGDEEDLEMEIPGAALPALRPVNKPGVAQALSPAQHGTLGGETPPCGQGTQIVPSTFASPTTNQGNKHRRMKSIKFSDSPQPHVPPRLALNPSKPRLAPAQPTVASTDTSSSNAPSSILPSTMYGASQVIPTTEEPVLETLPVQEVVFLTQLEPTPIEETVISSTVISQPTQFDTAQSSLCEVSRVEETRLPSTKTPPKPFDNFKSAYPAHSGSLADFVKACYYLQSLRRKRAIPGFLYDDFIRAFSENYVDYVEGYSDEKGKPLTAISWYNEFVEEPRFVQGVVNKQNLDDQLEAYPEEVAVAIQSSSHSQSSNAPSAVVSPPEKRVDTEADRQNKPFANQSPTATVMIMTNSEQSSHLIVGSAESCARQLPETAPARPIEAQQQPTLLPPPLPRQAPPSRGEEPQQLRKLPEPVVVRETPPRRLSSAASLRSPSVAGSWASTSPSLTGRPARAAQYLSRLSSGRVETRKSDPKSALSRTERLSAYLKRRSADGSLPSSGRPKEQ